MAQLDEVSAAIGRMEAKLDAALESQKDSREQAKGFDDRLKSLERSRSWSIGAAAAVGFLASVLKETLLGKIKGP